MINIRKKLQEKYQQNRKQNTQSRREKIKSIDENFMYKVMENNREAYFGWKTLVLKIFAVKWNEQNTIAQKIKSINREIYQVFL